MQAKLDASRDQIVEHYLPLVLASPPDKLRGRCGDVTEETARSWILGELTKVFPKAEDLSGKMKLEVHYKDMTFETLNEDGFLKAIEKIFDGVNWSIPYNEFKAAAETERPSPLNVG